MSELNSKSMNFFTWSRQAIHLGRRHCVCKSDICTNMCQCIFLHSMPIHTYIHTCIHTHVYLYSYLTQSVSFLCFFSLSFRFAAAAEWMHEEKTDWNVKYIQNAARAVYRALILVQIHENMHINTHFIKLTRKQCHIFKMCMVYVCVFLQSNYAK